MILGGHFDILNKETRVQEIESLLNDSNIWNDNNHAMELNKELTSLKKEVDLFNELKDNLELNQELLDITDNCYEIESSLNDLNGKVNELKKYTYLNGKFDNNACYLEIHPGAGGTESCDWALMLLRMYERFCDKNNFKYEEIDYQKGDEAGIKSCNILITGPYAYGYLKHEVGVHRLIRISPFDSNKRRHTSFCSVSITPQINEDINVEINEADLKIDVYRSSGNGGQGVNTTDSAVRITHLPTKIVVTCQNERSQIQNKERALNILKSKLLQIEEAKNKAFLNSFSDNSMINFGSQIRTYTLEPFQLVKDHRTNYENADAFKILDGEILEMLENNLTIE